MHRRTNNKKTARTSPIKSPDQGDSLELAPNTGHPTRRDKTQSQCAYPGNAHATDPTRWISSIRLRVCVVKPLEEEEEEEEEEGEQRGGKAVVS